jgi:hypothetical protein
MKLVLASVLVFLVACNRGEKVPAGILPKEKMQVLMWDMIRADELVSYRSSMDSSIKLLPASISLYRSVFEIHKVSEKEFRESFRYYEAHPKLFKSVLDSLQRKAAFLNVPPSATY